MSSSTLARVSDRWSQMMAHEAHEMALTRLGRRAFNFDLSHMCLPCVLCRTSRWELRPCSSRAKSRCDRYSPSGRGGLADAQDARSQNADGAVDQVQNVDAFRGSHLTRDEDPPEGSLIECAERSAVEVCEPSDRNTLAVRTHQGCRAVPMRPRCAALAKPVL